MSNSLLIKTKRTKRMGYVFILPALTFFAIYVLYPIIFITRNSVFKWSTLNDQVFVGFENFKTLLTDDIFWKTVKNSLVWIVVTVPVQAIIGFFLAYAIEEVIRKKHFRGTQKSQSFYRTLYFIPVVISVTVVAIIFSKIFQPYQGIIGYYLNKFFGASPTINVLGDPNKALFGVMLANIWEWTGWSMLMYIGGMSQISADLIEASEIDGASTWQKIRYIYIPSLASVHKALLMLGVIGSLQTYALVNVMTNGGPNHATEMPGTYIFLKGFTQTQMGYACTISVAILLFALVLTAIQIRFLGSGDFMKTGGGRSGK
ncbi:MAG: sugar ABC transporter permease [Saccharofermentanales bacterium]